MLKNLLYILAVIFTFSGCAIRNDIPYPIEEGIIEAFEVEGQCDASGTGTASAVINAEQRTVTLYVDDTVDLTNLEITRFSVSSDADIQVVDPTVCDDASKFPVKGFDIPDNLANTRVDFSKPVQFLLHTYQDYVWTVTVTQVINREIDVQGQINSVIDVNNKVCIIYVSEDTDLDNIQINKLDLGGASGKVKPDPATVHDFTSPQSFMVANGWEEVYSEWTVYVYQQAGGASTATEAFAMSTRATVSGNIQSGKTPVVEYKENSASLWQTLAASNVSVKGTKFTATFSKLRAATTYQYRVNVDNVEGTPASFTTAPATPLPNGSFDDWSSESATNGTLWKPWGTGTSDNFWDTGNKGATTIGDSNSVPTTETCNGSGKAALLQSKWVVLKLAAGNIFAGSYVKTDGTNGILSFGRPFTAFPTALRFHYKYTTGKINRCGDSAMEYLKDRPDSCHIYIALSDKDEPYEIKTRPSERKLFSKNDANVIAYGEFISGQSTSEYKEITVNLDYKATDRTPKYIILTASASKYGDYFVGCDEAKLWLDEMELVYE